MPTVSITPELFRALAAGLLGFGFPLLIFRAWDVATGRAILFFVLVGVFFFGSAGALLRLIPSRKSYVLPALFSALVLSAVTFSFPVPENWKVESLFMIFSWALTLTACGFAQAAVLTESRQRISTLVHLTLGSFLGNLGPLSLEYLSFPEAVRTFLLLGAVLILLGVGLSLKVRGSAAALLAGAIYFWPIAHPDPISEYKEGKIYSNSFSQLKVAKLSSGVLRGKKIQRDKESFVRPGFENLNIYTIIRNAKEATLIYDAAHEKDLGILKQNLTYRLLTAVVKKNRAAVVGSGAGHEVQMALLDGFREVVAVEINPLMIKAANEFSRRPDLSYQSPRVQTVIDDAHHWARHLSGDDKFDLILLSNVRFYGSSGAQIFNENYVNTFESLRAMVRNLVPGGVLIIRHHHGKGAYFHKILVSTLHAAAREITDEGELFVSGVSPGGEDLMGTNLGVVAIYRRGKFSPAELDILKEAVWGGFDQHVINVHADQPAAKLIATVDRPYPDWLAVRYKRHGFLPPLYIAGLLLVLVSVSVPLALGVARPRDSAFLIYAFLSGAAFLGTELIYLWSAEIISGLPSWSAFVTVSTLLASGALGTLVSGMTKRSTYWPLSLVGVAVYSMGLWPLISQTEKFPVDGGSALLCLSLLIFPAGLILGFAYGQFFRACGERVSPALVVASNGFGGLAAGVGLKLLSLEAGHFSVHLLTLTAFTGMWLIQKKIGLLTDSGTPGV